jgi:hypothetical protein
LTVIKLVCSEGSFDKKGNDMAGEDTNGGAITFGGYDKEHCSNKISYAPLSTAANGSIWTVNVTR